MKPGIHARPRTARSTTPNHCTPLIPSFIFTTAHYQTFVFSPYTILPRHQTAHFYSLPPSLVPKSRQLPSSDHIPRQLLLVLALVILDAPARPRRQPTGPGGCRRESARCVAHGSRWWRRRRRRCLLCLLHHLRGLTRCWESAVFACIMSGARELLLFVSVAVAVDGEGTAAAVPVAAVAAGVLEDHPPCVCVNEVSTFVLAHIFSESGRSIENRNGKGR